MSNKTLGEIAHLLSGLDHLEAQGIEAGNAATIALHLGLVVQDEFAILDGFAQGCFQVDRSAICCQVLRVASATALASGGVARSFSVIRIASGRMSLSIVDI